MDKYLVCNLTAVIVNMGVDHGILKQGHAGSFDKQRHEGHLNLVLFTNTLH